MEKINGQQLKPGDLNEQQKAALIDELYAVQRQVFDGVDRDKFARYVINSTATETWLTIFRNESGAAVGYATLHQFGHTLQGKRCIVLRAEAGTLRRYRGHTPQARFFIQHILGCRLRHPTTPMYYLGSLVHPSSYHAFARYSAEIWPNHRQETPPEMQQFLCDLGDAYGLERVDPSRPLVRAVGWVTRDSEEEEAYWKNCKKPTAQFFVKANPGYIQGEGLLTLISLSTPRVIQSLTHFLQGYISLQRQGLHARMQTVPGFRPQLNISDISALLRSLEVFASLDERTQQVLTQASTVQIVPRGQYVFRKNDRGDAMYVVLEGAVYVLLEQDQQERVLDQLSQGQMFGEMALLTGDPRLASVRTATATRLLRIDRALLEELVERSSEMAQALWGLFGFRRFATYARGLERFSGLNSAAIRELYDGARLLPTEPGKTLQLNSPALLFLAAGTVELGARDVWCAIQAPSVLDLTEPTRLKSIGVVRLMRLPDSRTMPMRTNLYPSLNMAEIQATQTDSAPPTRIHREV